jgi:hypothetical protein
MCFFMVLWVLRESWGRTWRAVTRVRTTLPTGKARNAILTAVLTPLVVCIPVLALVLTYAVRGVDMHSERTLPDPFFSLEPLFLGTALVFVAFDMAWVWPSRLFRGTVTVIGTGVTMAFFLVLSEWTSPFKEPWLLLIGCLVVVLGAWLTLYLVRRVLDNSEFFRKVSAE